MTTSQVAREAVIFLLKGGEGLNWYFIETERFEEEKVKQILINSGFDAFIPKKEMYFKKGEFTEITQRLLFPGTVMVSDPESPPQFTQKLNDWLALKKSGSELIRLESDTYYSLSNKEKACLSQLLDSQRILRFSTGVIRQRELHVLKGPLQGHEKEIQKIKRHQRLATLPVQLCGQTIALIVGLEVIEKIG